MKKTISHGQLESLQAYNYQPYIKIHSEVYQCKSCMIWTYWNGDRDICDECWDNYKKYQCSDCVKCEHLFPMEQMSEDGYCLDCFIEENPIKN